jgi:hypothetical protein
MEREAEEPKRKADAKSKATEQDPTCIQKAQDHAFADANKPDLGGIPTHYESFERGDTVTIDGEEFTVIAVNEDGTVVLEDGGKFGKQALEDGEITWVETEDSPYMSDENMTDEVSSLIEAAQEKGYQSVDGFAAAAPPVSRMSPEVAPHNLTGAELRHLRLLALCRKEEAKRKAEKR